MDGIYGLIQFDGAPIDTCEQNAMDTAMAFWGTDLQSRRIGPSAVMGGTRRPDRDQAHSEAQRSLLAKGCTLIAAARIDNHSELCELLGISGSERAALTDTALVELAYLRWGEKCVEKLYGDWAFAVWNSHQRRLFLARDHHGNTALYYTAIDRYFAFASSRKALLALDKPELHAIDDLYIAQVMLSWPVYHGERTVHSAIRRLPPSHCLETTSPGVRTHRYWRLEEVPQRSSCSLEEAVEGFLPVFEAAVRSRLRGTDCIATTLSGGLDSGSVTAVAARILQERGKPLLAYTSAPVSDSALSNDRWFGDEWNLANRTAVHIGNVDHRRVSAAGVTPLEAVRMSLWTHDEPQHAAGNAFWLVDLMRTARADGCRALLTGQGGNAGISWPGSLPLRFQRRPITLRGRAKRIMLSVMPDTMGIGMQTLWLQRTTPWVRRLAIHPELVQRTDALRRSVSDREHPIHAERAGSRARRLALIMPGRSIVGCLHAENGAAHGLQVLDPTLDTRVLSYCLSLPERILFDSRTKMDRLLIRTAMQGRLPDDVRLNRKRGLQAADLPFRLRADRDAMEACLDDLQHGPATDYLNMQRLRLSWSVVQERDDEEAYREASVVLLRAIMVGLFVNRPALVQRPMISAATQGVPASVS